MLHGNNLAHASDVDMAVAHVLNIKPNKKSWSYPYASGRSGTDDRKALLHELNPAALYISDRNILGKALSLPPRALFSILSHPSSLMASMKLKARLSLLRAPISAVLPEVAP